MMQKFKVGDRVTCVDNRGAPDHYVKGATYPVTSVSGYGRDEMLACAGMHAAMYAYRFKRARAFDQSTHAVTPTAPKLPRLELQAAPQGGFLVVAPSASMGSMSETLSAHSEIGDALEFMRRAMA